MGIRDILGGGTPSGEATSLRQGEDLVRLDDGSIIPLAEFVRSQRPPEGTPPVASTHPMFGRTTRAQDSSGEFGPPTAGITDRDRAVVAITVAGLSALTGTPAAPQQSPQMGGVFSMQYPDTTRETHSVIPSAVVERQPAASRLSVRKLGVGALAAIVIASGIYMNVRQGSDNEMSAQQEQSPVPTEFVLQSVVGAQLPAIKFTAKTATIWDFTDNKTSDALGPKADETWFDLKTTGKINWTINAVYDPADTKKSAIVETTKAADKKTGERDITIDLRKTQLTATVTGIDSPNIPFFTMAPQKKLEIVKGSKVAGSATVTVASLDSLYNETIGGLQNRQVAYALDQIIRDPTKRTTLLDGIKRTIREQLGLTNNPAVSITFTGEDKAFLPAKPTDPTAIAAAYLKKATGLSDLVQLYSTKENPASVDITPNGQGT